MTTADFDPRNLDLYQEPKYLLHVEWGKSPLIYRYALVEVIKPDNILSKSKQKPDELGLTQKEIWSKKYKSDKWTLAIKN